jgi:hypothetical protein
MTHHNYQNISTLTDILLSLIVLRIELIDDVISCWFTGIWRNVGIFWKYTTLISSTCSWAVAFHKSNWHVFWFCWQAIDVVRLFIWSIRHKHWSHVILEIFIYSLSMCDKFNTQLAFWIRPNWIVASVFTTRRISMIRYIFEEKTKENVNILFFFYWNEF